MNSFFKILKGDRGIWIVLIILSLFSLLVVYSATGSLAHRQVGGNTFFYLARHMGFLFLGYLVIILFVNYVPVKFISIISPVLLMLSLVFIVVALALKGGGEATGRTFTVGGISFQPAETAKITLVWFVAKLLANNQDKDNVPSRRIFFWILGISAVVCFAIMMADFSTAALLFATIMIMMFVGRIKMKFLVSTIAAGIVVLVIFYTMASFVEMGRFSTYKGRIDRFLFGDPNSEIGMTQAEFAEMAIYHGGRLGAGPGGSEVRNHMAAAYNDFIFAILVEEYGWISFVVVLCFIIFAARAAIIINQSKRTFPAFMVAGLSTMIVLQAMANMGVAVGILPVTGQTLPWVSMGGTSTLFTAVSFGCILRVSYLNKIEKTSDNAAIEAEEKLPDEDHTFAEVGAID
jgi:cell division protein FtsW